MPGGTLPKRTISNAVAATVAALRGEDDITYEEFLAIARDVGISPVALLERAQDGRGY